MALSEDLPLYRDTYRLLNNLLALTQDFPRFFRYSMGSRMVDLTLDMLSLHTDRISRPLPDVADALPRMRGAEGDNGAEIRLFRAADGEDRQTGYKLEAV